MKNNKGITLIALVITIIVMLILLGVTIKVAQDGSLFKHAANATSKTKQAATEENAILDGNIRGKSIEDIVGEQTGNLSDIAKLRIYYIEKENIDLDGWVEEYYYGEEVGFVSYKNNYYELTIANGDVTEVNLLTLNGDVFVVWGGIRENEYSKWIYKIYS